MSKNAAMPTRRLFALDHQRDALAAADAERREAEPRVPIRHGVEERHQDARAARADRMPEGDGATVDVDARLRDAQLPQHAERLRGERLVQFPQIDFFAPETSAG